MTPNQFKTLEFVGAQVAAQGFAPSLQEIADHVGLVSRSNICVIVRNLVGAGLIRRLPGQAHRNLDLTDAGRAMLARKEAA